MATHDPMDLDIRSQAFFRDFYLFYKQSCDAWYIKDADHRFMDASITFLSRFLSPKLSSAIGLADRDISVASDRDINLMHDFESYAMMHEKNIILFSYGYFCDKDKVKSFIINIKPFASARGDMVMVLISELSQVNHKLDWLSAVTGIGTNPCCDFLLPTYKNHDPRSLLTAGEWEVAWLLICGCSIRKIARYLNVSVKTIQVKTRSVYMSLRVFDKNGLLKTADAYNWINLIPESYVGACSLIKIL
ncbi:hypothetical protein NG99_24060 [Erwinia typographi]|uniref:HTH luxR-type domain-containing protein n=1 Tax=Erwinia typographi TaxID=371042 RepID=A0A0A3YP63_9GAMM|nr:LuxR C-terminal-related transcriptional regulator [Erwinia typographi]KGT87126.1 hypothetical protein NG99_24060 [Erwinia typographi]